MTNIGYAAFSNCFRLVGISIPNSVTIINDYSFLNCINLTIYVQPTNKPSGWNANWNFSNCPVVWGCILAGTQGLKYTLINNGTEYEVWRGTATDANVIIPTIYNGLPVTSIAAFGFINSNITNIIIPNSITQIGDWAFYGCNNLLNVSIPAGVIYISNYAFAYCDNLTSVILPNNLTGIGDYAFFGCGSLISMNISDSVVNIGESAFYGCYNLGTQGLAYTLINNGTAYSVSRGTATVASIIIPEAHNGLPVTAIAANGFNNYTGMTNILIPNSITIIGDSAFGNCNSLKSIKISINVTYIGYHAFNNCSNLTIYAETASQPAWHINWNPLFRPVVWGSILTGTRGLAFTPINNGTAYEVSKGSATDANITIPTIFNGLPVTAIAANGFINYTNITSITISNILTSIGDRAFYGCSNLLNFAIPPGVTYISNYAFAYCDNLTDAVLPNNLTGIGDYAFFGCGSLTNINISNNVINIGINAFYGCNNLGTQGLAYTLINGGAEYEVGRGTVTNKNVIIPAVYNGKPVTKIAVNGFINNTTLTNIVIPDNITIIGNAAFYGCINLKSIIIPKSVIVIEDSAFGKCSGLINITIPSSVTRIDNNVFSGCDNITIYANFESKPTGWHSNWNPLNRPVVWTAGMQDLNNDIHSLIIIPTGRYSALCGLDGM